MKKIIALFIICLSFNAQGQEMKFVYGNIYIGDVQITPAIAKQRSIYVSSEAYMLFKKASTIRGWNYFWGVFGAYEVIAGAANLSENSVAILDIGIGGVCIGIIPGRESKRLLFMNDAVNAFNEALAKKRLNN